MHKSEAIQIAPDKNGPREWIFSFNHAAMFSLEELIDKPGWSLLVDPRDTAKKILYLAWSASETFRYRTNQTLSFKEFLHGEWLPPYLSESWEVFKKCILDLVEITFPEATRIRQLLVAEEIMSLAREQVRQELLESIGTNEFTSQSESSE